MQVILSDEELITFWEEIEKDLNRILEADIKSYSVKERKGFNKVMMEKLVNLCKKDDTLKELCNIDISKSQSFKVDISATFRRVFTSRDFNTGDATKHRFAIYLGYKSATEYVDARNIRELTEYRNSNKKIGRKASPELIKGFEDKASDIRRSLAPYLHLNDVNSYLEQIELLHRRHIENLTFGYEQLSNKNRGRIWHLSHLLYLTLRDLDSPFGASLPEGFYLKGNTMDFIFSTYFGFEKGIPEEVISFIENENPSSDEVNPFYDDCLNRFEQSSRQLSRK